MKNIIIIFVTYFSLISFKANPINEFSIVGKWEAEVENDMGSIVFQEDGYSYFIINGEVLGGKDFIQKGKKGSMTFEMNKHNDYLHIDFIMRFDGSGKEKKLLALVEIINKDQLRMQLGFEGLRPVKFDEKESAILNRVK